MRNPKNESETETQNFLLSKIFLLKYSHFLPKKRRGPHFLRHCRGRPGRPGPTARPGPWRHDDRWMLIVAPADCTRIQRMNDASG